MSCLSHKLVCIRKPHQCFSCYRKFDKGTKMYLWAAIYEGDFNTGYTCETCEKIMQFSDPEDGGYPGGFVSEWLDKGQTPEQLLEILEYENKNQKHFKKGDQVRMVNCPESEHYNSKIWICYNDSQNAPYNSKKIVVFLQGYPRWFPTCYLEKV